MQDAFSLLQIDLRGHNPLVESLWSREIHVILPRGKETKDEPHWSTPQIVRENTGSCFGTTRNFIPASGQTAVCLENVHKIQSMGGQLVKVNLVRLGGH